MFITGFQALYCTRQNAIMHPTEAVVLSTRARLSYTTGATWYSCPAHRRPVPRTLLLLRISSSSNGAIIVIKYLRIVLCHCLLGDLGGIYVHFSMICGSVIELNDCRSLRFDYFFLMQ